MTKFLCLFNFYKHAQFTNRLHGYACLLDYFLWSTVLTVIFSGHMKIKFTILAICTLNFCLLRHSILFSLYLHIVIVTLNANTARLEQVRHFLFATRTSSILILSLLAFLYFFRLSLLSRFDAANTVWISSSIFLPAMHTHPLQELCWCTDNNFFLLEI